ncbi:MAG: Jag N-terminal domain-containing protein [Desulfobacteraceae bacterium]|nr:Jag N-terminal domain-containing protein [Desulfobacteraceae bacterium]
MSEYRDFEEKNVERAIENACAELGLSPEKLKYDIISHGSSGIFGLVGSKKAVIRVFFHEKHNNAESKGEGADKFSGDRGAEENKTASALVDEAFGPSSGESHDATPPAESYSSETLEIDANSRQAAADWTKGFIERVLALISPDSTINVKDEEEVIRFEVHGGDSARLIGKRGQTLDAIHYLVERGVYKQFGSSVPIEIDVEGYLEKRRTELTALATRLAEKARQTGKPMVINRINAQDRRVVHLSLKGNREVRTQSVGNGDLRKLLIMPKKKPQTGRYNSGDQ